MAVTTDYRHVLSEILVKRLDNPAAEIVFQDYHAKVLDVILE